MGAAVTQRRNGVVAHLGVLAALGALGALVWMFVSVALGGSAAHADTTSPGGSGPLRGIAATVSATTGDATGTIGQVTGTVVATSTDAAIATVDRVPVAATVAAPVVKTVRSTVRAAVTTVVTPVVKMLGIGVVGPVVDPIVGDVASAATGLATGATPAVAGELPTAGIGSPGPTDLERVVAPPPPAVGLVGAPLQELALPARAFATAATIASRSILPVWMSPSTSPPPTFPFPGACAPGASCSSAGAGSGAAGALSALAFFAAYRAWLRRGSPGDGIPHSPVYATDTSPG